MTAERGFASFAEWQRTAWPRDATAERIAEWWRVSGAPRKAAWAVVEKRATDAEAEVARLQAVIAAAEIPVTAEGLAFRNTGK